MAAVRQLDDFVEPADQKLLIDPVSIIEKPASVKTGIDPEAIAQSIQSLQQAPMQFFHFDPATQLTTDRHPAQAVTA
jgi:hypothetical protein